MKELSLYRKRIIPAECILLKDDEILSFEEDKLVTRWHALHPKQDLHHGISCYFLKEGWKVSKFYRADNSLLYWYVDIIDHSWHSHVGTYKRGQAAPTADQTTASMAGNHLLITDLLADVILYPDGTYKVVDLSELSDAYEAGSLSPAMLIEALRKLDSFLAQIYSGSFADLKSYIEGFEGLP